jgi:hypothetical protein
MGSNPQNACVGRFKVRPQGAGQIRRPLNRRLRTYLKANFEQMRQAPSPRSKVRFPFVRLFWALGLCWAISPFAVSGEPGPETIDLIPQAMEILGGRESNEADRATRFLEAFLKANPQVYQRPQLGN